MAISGNIAINQGKLYRFNKAPVRAVEVALPKVKIEFWGGRQAWIHGTKLTDF